MANDSFQFKQFIIRQDRCAMKVTMDACIFGAWIPLPDRAVRVLDVGTGTGLLSLMLAQRFPNAQIDAIELAEDAAAQALENSAASPFADRITVHHLDARTFSPHERYDAIVCNPPFFSKSMVAPQQHRAMARHDERLTFDDLREAFEKLLKPDGTAYILLPAMRVQEWVHSYEARGWHTAHATFLSSREGDEPSRAFVVVSRKGEQELTTAHLVKYDKSGGALAADVARLLQPFYLKL